VNERSHEEAPKVRLSGKYLLREDRTDEGDLLRGATRPQRQKAYSITTPVQFERLQGCIDWWAGKTRKGREA
jgi:hypothetical protein